MRINQIPLPAVINRHRNIRVIEDQPKNAGIDAHLHHRAAHRQIIVGHRPTGHHHHQENYIKINLRQRMQIKFVY